jgi:hypothetical protein
MIALPKSAVNRRCGIFLFLPVSAPPDMKNQVSLVIGRQSPVGLALEVLGNPVNGIFIAGKTIEKVD